MRLLVIGGCGFVGSNFVRYVLQHYGPEMVTNLDALTTGRLENLEGVAAQFAERYEFLRADVGDAARVDAVLEKHQFFGVVHFAAEAAGGAGTQVLLESSRRHGVRRFLIPSKPSPGAALIAAEELAMRACGHADQEIVLTRSVENFGPCQPRTALIPRLIRHALAGEPIAIAPEDVPRRWLHVEDHCSALFTALLDGEPGTSYTLAAGAEWWDHELAYRVVDYLGKSRDLVKCSAASVQTTRAISDLPALLGWAPRRPPEEALRDTIDWYIRNREWWEQPANV